MAVYSGKFTIQLDSKCRVILPAVLRKIAEQEDPSREFYLTQYTAGCLHLYTSVGFREKLNLMRDNIDQIVDESELEEAELVYARFLHQSVPLSLGEQGRLQVPSELATEAGFKFDMPVLVVGSDEVIEIWSPEKYEERFTRLKLNPAKSDATLRRITRRPRSQNPKLAAVKPNPTQSSSTTGNSGSSSLA